MCRGQGAGVQSLTPLSADDNSTRPVERSTVSAHTVRIVTLFCMAVRGVAFAWPPPACAVMPVDPRESELAAAAARAMVPWRAVAAWAALPLRPQPASSWRC